MEDFSQRIMDGSGIKPPEKCQKVFKDNFPDSLNAEWFLRGDHYEAIFYKDKIEYIAAFKPEGTLIEYKMYLTAEFLPEPVRIILTGKGEIMNVVLINNGRSIVYECIVRDPGLNRSLVYISNLGKLLEERSL